VKNIKAAEAEKRAGGLVPVYVFIAPPSLEELESRLRGRHTENETEIQR
jgi:guanylate kinase